MLKALIKRALVGDEQNAILKKTVMCIDVRNNCHKNYVISCRLYCKCTKQSREIFVLYLGLYTNNHVTSFLFSRLFNYIIFNNNL